LGQLRGRQPLALGPIGEASLGDHATDLLEAFEDRSDELDWLFEPPSELVQVDVFGRAAIGVAAGAAQCPGKARLHELHRRASNIGDAQKLSVVGKVMKELAPSNLGHDGAPVLRLVGAVPGPKVASRKLHEEGPNC
jgi:hypothetical protein